MKELIENKALAFVSENGQQLANHIRYQTGKAITELDDTIWSLIEKTNHSSFFKHKDDGMNVFFMVFLATRATIELSAVNKKYGSEVSKKLEKYIYKSVKKVCGFITKRLLKDSSIVFQEDDSGQLDIIMARLCSTVLGHSKAKISPSIFYPFIPILSEGGNVVDGIKDNI